MYDPESFATKSQCCVEATSKALASHGHLIQWRTAGQDTLIDAGFGPGNMLRDVIYPMLGNKCSKVYAVDKTDEMIDYCKERYKSSLDKVQFVKMDVEDKGDIKKFIKSYGPVDHVLGSFLLHWFVDQKQGLHNIFQLLKPGGDFFSVHFHSCITLQMHEHVQKWPKWGHYFRDLDTKHTPTSTKNTNYTERDLHETLAQCGFVDTFVELNRSTVTMARKDLLILTKSVHVQIQNIPEDKVDEYLQDYVGLGIEKNIIRIDEISGGLEFDFNTFVAYGRRPE